MYSSDSIIVPHYKKEVTWHILMSPYFDEPVERLEGAHCNHGVVDSNHVTSLQKKKKRVSINLFRKRNLE